MLEAFGNGEIMVFQKGCFSARRAFMFKNCSLFDDSFLRVPRPN